MGKVRGRYVDNPACFGFEWTSEEGTRFQIVGSRGVYGPPQFGMRADGNTEWSVNRMADKWVVDGTRDAFRAMVDKFMAEGDE